MRSALAFAVSFLAAAACGSAEVVVSIEIDVDDPAGGGPIRRTLSEVEVRLLPFDRDAVFDSLAAAMPTPEPDVPTDLLAARAELRAAQAEWDQHRGPEGEMNAAFARFDSLHEATTRASDSVRALRERWSDAAFADVASIFAAKADAAGRAGAVDITGASGVASGSLRVRPGAYWVHARYELAYAELYWNVPVTVARGDVLEVRLTRSNAEERLRL